MTNIKGQDDIEKTMLGGALIKPGGRVEHWLMVSGHMLPSNIANKSSDEQLVD
jgi:hypothetical protein